MPLGLNSLIYKTEDLVPSQSLNGQVILSAPQSALQLEMAPQAADTGQSLAPVLQPPSPPPEDTRPCC